LNLGLIFSIANELLRQCEGIARHLSNAFRGRGAGEMVHAVAHANSGAAAGGRNCSAFDQHIVERKRLVPDKERICASAATGPGALADDSDLL